jgi:phosphoribosylanthranilate isomerase
MTRVKICGCMKVPDAVAAKDAGADFIGIMFAPGSRRRISIEEAQAIVEAVGPSLREIEVDSPPPLRHGSADDTSEWFRHGAEALDALLARKRPLTVGVFEDQSSEDVNAIADDVGLDLIQLSGRESWSDCLLANRQVVKAIEPLASIEPGTAIACLIDASRGRGIEADRESAAAIASRMPVWLAGGLTPDNVVDVLRDVRPWAVDVSSGVETDGAKDAAKVRDFVRAAKEAMSIIEGGMGWQYRRRP